MHEKHDTGTKPQTNKTSAAREQMARDTAEKPSSK